MLIHFIDSKRLIDDLCGISNHTVYFHFCDLYNGVVLPYSKIYYDKVNYIKVKIKVQMYKYLTPIRMPDLNCALKINTKEIILSTMWIFQL